MSKRTERVEVPPALRPLTINYSSNNSGGDWWLKDQDWKALEAAGWKVEWKKDQNDFGGRPYKDGRWLGALATKASKQFDSPASAMREFERITGQTVSDEGCNCCGAPHSFNWEGPDGYDYASGEGCLAHLYPNVEPMTVREAYEARARKGA